MKKLAITASLLSIVGTAQAASTGTITFQGELTASTCNVVVNGQAANASVILPAVGINRLIQAAQTSGRSGFIVTQNNCAGTLKNTSAFFEAGTNLMGSQL